MRPAAHRDRGVKFDFHRGPPSLRHIVLIHQDQMRIEHHRRDAEDRTVDVLQAPSRRLDLDAVGFAIDLDAITFDVPVLRPVAAPDGEREPPTPIA